nr:hypothetical protein [Priestia taiwanensis]
MFPDEIFDLNSEYTPNSFVPTQTGVYYICASVGFVPTNGAIASSITMNIEVNAVRQVVSTNIFVPGLTVDNSNSISTILQLNVGDIVTVTFTLDNGDGSGGTILASGEFTSFSAARVPSP